MKPILISLDERFDQLLKAYRSGVCLDEEERDFVSGYAQNLIFSMDRIDEIYEINKNKEAQKWTNY